MSETSELRLHPRAKIQECIARGDIETVLEMAGVLHGHYCPGLALGVKATQVAFEKLGITDNTGMEEIMAVTECNSCFVDGIQFAAGCTLGNNALVYQDIGKTAATFYRRSGNDAVRLYVKKFQIASGSEEERREGDALFDKAVKRRELLSDAESRRMKEIWIERSFATVRAAADTLFAISTVPVPRLPFAPIFDSQECSECKESVMEAKATFRQGHPICISCSHAEYRMVIGKGIATGRVLGT